jgi:hypothetical protein
MIYSREKADINDGLLLQEIAAALPAVNVAYIDKDGSTINVSILSTLDAADEAALYATIDAHDHEPLALYMQALVAQAYMHYQGKLSVGYEHQSGVFFSTSAAVAGLWAWLELKASSRSYPYNLTTKSGTYAVADLAEMQVILDATSGLFESIVQAYGIAVGNITSAADKAAADAALAAYLAS